MDDGKVSMFAGAKEENIEVGKGRLNALTKRHVQLFTNPYPVVSK